MWVAWEFPCTVNYAADVAISRSGSRSMTEFLTLCWSRSSVAKQQRAIPQSTPERQVIYVQRSQVGGDLVHVGEACPTNEPQERIAARPTDSQLQPSHESSPRLSPSAKLTASRWRCSTGVRHW